MEPELISRVTILAVGVERYQYMRPLSGPSSDIKGLHDLLVTSPATALFGEEQFKELLDPDSSQLRSLINEYTLSRSASGDIMIFYFSGHGVPIGRNDFGFCTVDTAIHPGPNAVLPLTVVKFSDLLDTVSLVGITPIVIIDACYSGRAGDVIISPHDAIGTIHQEIQKTAASSYALLCSCSDVQSSLDGPKGGVFSRCLLKVVGTGIADLKENPHLIGLKDIYHPLSRLVEAEPQDAIPRLYLGDTLPDFPLVKNVSYVPQSYSFVGHLLCVIKALWNEGKERELSPAQILKLCGSGAYGNHRKLSLDPWKLVENAPNSKNRRLTERGRLFAQGKLKIPRTIQEEPAKEIWVPSPGSIEVDIYSTEG